MTALPSAPVRSRKRSQRGRGRCQVTPGRFWVHGYPAGRDDLHPRKVMVIWDNGSLSGDPELVADVLERAHELGRDLANPKEVLALLLGSFLVGSVDTGGDLPRD